MAAALNGWSLDISSAVPRNSDEHVRRLLHRDSSASSSNANGTSSNELETVPPQRLLLHGRIVGSQASSAQRRAIHLIVAYLSEADRAGALSSSVDEAQPVDKRPRMSRDEHASTQSSSKGSGTNNGDEESVECVVNVDVTSSSENSAWFSVLGARRLLCSGASIELVGVLQSVGDEQVISDSSTSGASAKAGDKEAQSQAHLPRISAEYVRLVSVVPEPSAVLRCLQLPEESLGALFGGAATQSFPSSGMVRLAAALRPCSVSLCSELRQLPPSHTAAMDPRIRSLCASMRQAQGWTRKKLAMPPPPAGTWEAVLRLETKWCADSCLRSSPEVAMQAIQTDIDPLLNLPDGLSEKEEQRRREYINHRKRPQVQWMIELIKRLRSLVTEGKRELVTTTGGQKSKAALFDPCFHCVDVGGGRGDLALGLATALGESVRVTVLDVNESSLAAGRDRASAAGLGNIQFHLCDIQEFATSTGGKDDGEVDLVFGLHCCGGLTEAALELAARTSAAFAVASCCFRSNRHLGTLGSMADSMSIASVTTSPSSEGADKGSIQYSSASDHELDRDRACLLAVWQGFHGQARAQRAVNAARLRACKAYYKDLSTKNETQAESVRRPDIETWLEEFPSKYSKQNSVLIGLTWSLKMRNGSQFDVAGDDEP